MNDYRIDPQPCHVIPGWLAFIWNSGDIVRVVFGKSEIDVRLKAAEWSAAQRYLPKGG